VPLGSVINDLQLKSARILRFQWKGRETWASQESSIDHFFILWGSLGSEPGQFNVPHALTVSEGNEVYVTEINGRRAQKFIKLIKI